MNEKAQIAFIPWRFYLLGLFISLVIATLILRITDLSVFERSFLLQQGDARALREVSEPAFRGMITDRDGYPLAISTSVYSVWINPKEFSDANKSIDTLAQILELKPESIRTLLQHYKNKNREFVYLKRELSPAIAKEIKALALSGIYLQQDYKRFYPEGEITAQLIGFTNIDDKGQEGLELTYNDWLSGASGKKIVLKDRKGRTISNLHTEREQKPGHDLALSIDRRMQYLAYRELMAGVQKNLASSGSVVILDVKTGEVYAMVNEPSFNPNKIIPNDKSNLRNRAVTDSFEPGSTIKSFSIATALDSGLYHPDSVIDTSPGWIRVDHHVLYDEHKNGPLTLTQILQISSNVGMSKVILSLPPTHLVNLLRRMGFGAVSEIGFPGEQAGKVPNNRVWSQTALTTLSFGYGISVTTLQLAHAYATLANDGVKVPLSLLRIEKQPQGERVMDAKIAREMLQLLQSVLAKGGTGVSANVPGYHVAGKTGTAWILGKEGYDKHRYTSSFIGIAPATHPRLVVAVVLHDPKGKQYYGGMVSGPIFEKIMEGSLRILNIAPDDPTSLPSAAAVEAMAER